MVAGKALVGPQGSEGGRPQRGQERRSPGVGPRSCAARGSPRLATRHVNRSRPGALLAQPDAGGQDRVTRLCIRVTAQGRLAVTAGSRLG